MKSCAIDDLAVSIRQLHEFKIEKEKQRGEDKASSWEENFLDPQNLTS